MVLGKLQAYIEHKKACVYPYFWERQQFIEDFLFLYFRNVLKTEKGFRDMAPPYLFYKQVTENKS